MCKKSRAELYTQIIKELEEKFLQEHRLIVMRGVVNLCTEKQVWNLLNKTTSHIAGLENFVNDLNKSLLFQPPIRWDEKLSDIKAYLIFLDNEANQKIKRISEATDD